MAFSYGALFGKTFTEVFFRNDIHDTAALQEEVAAMSVGRGGGFLRSIVAFLPFLHGKAISDIEAEGAFMLFGNRGGAAVTGGNRGFLDIVEDDLDFGGSKSENVKGTRTSMRNTQSI